MWRRNCYANTSVSLLFRWICLLEPNDFIASLDQWGEVFFRKKETMVSSFTSMQRGDSNCSVYFVRRWGQPHSQRNGGYGIKRKDIKIYPVSVRRSRPIYVHAYERVRMSCTAFCPFSEQISLFSIDFKLVPFFEVMGYDLRSCTVLYLLFISLLCFPSNSPATCTIILFLNHFSFSTSSHWAVRSVSF